jgi:hypothetical protein
MKPSGSEIPSKVTVLGAGHVGLVVARLAAAAGYEVSVSASGDPEEIALTVSVLAPGARAHWASEAVADADIVVLALPLHKFDELDPHLLAGKLVIDMMNYWPDVNGRLAGFDGAELASSEIVARRLAGSRVVKTLNHLGYHQLDEESRPKGDPGRRGLGVAGDDPDAVHLVADFVDRLGFDPVLVGPLAASRLLQPDGPVFGQPLSRSDFEHALGAIAA